jgi:hypothetical protein
VTAIAGGEQASSWFSGLQRPWGTLSPLRIQIPCGASGALILSQRRTCRGYDLMVALPSRHLQGPFTVNPMLQHSNVPSTVLPISAQS